MQRESEPKVNPEIHPSWGKVLDGAFHSPSFLNLRSFLKNEKRQGATIFPPGNLIFNAFNSTPFEEVKVVIIGQDPYHGPGQAHGLCFSVNKGVKIPPSLQNIYKELEKDLGISPPDHGNLQKWAEQGVLLLNAILTVRAKNAASHRGKGWEEFTDEVIRQLNEKREGLVFMLWGRFAQNKGAVIDPDKHLILKSAHPSPFSASGFFGNRHFSKANEFLEAQNLDPIDWNPD